MKKLPTIWQIRDKPKMVNLTTLIGQQLLVNLVGMLSEYIQKEQMVLTSMQSMWFLRKDL